MRATKEIVPRSQANLRPRPPATNTRQRTFLILGLILVASVAVRLAAFKIWGTGAIESEGAEYARIAENLRNGTGYVGIVTPGPELMFPPLFPLLISAFSFLTGSYVRAGRLISLILGTLLPLPAFGIASRLFNRRVGFVAAVLVMLHPLLVNLSLTVLTEGPYATLLLSAVYLALRALDRPSTVIWGLVGGAFGVCYLLRQEAVAPLLIALLFLLVATEGTFAIRCKRAVAATVVFVAFAAPEVVFLYRATAKLRLEGKSAITMPLAIRVLDKETELRAQGGVPDPHDEALKWGSSAINDKLERLGVWLIPEVQVSEEKVAFKDLVRVVVKAVRQNTPLLIQNLSSRWLGAPFLPAVALLGMVRRPWRQPRALRRLYVMLVPTTAVVASFSVLWIFPRYYFVLVPFLLLWAANGLVEIGSWINASTSAARWHWRRAAASHCIVPAVIGLAMVVYPIRGVRDLFEFTEGAPANRAAKDVGEWIRRQQDGSVTIMDRSTPLAFHAGAQFVYFPYCNGDLALRFLDSAKVDYVVLRRSENFSAYYVDWFKNGIPDARAQLVYASSGANAGEIVVFRWHRPDAHYPALPTPVPVALDGQPAPEAPTLGPLRVDARNPRYFADRRGKVVLLAGSHTWGNFQDAGRLTPVPFDYEAYLNYLTANGHNFMRLYSWEQADWASWRPYDWWISPTVYQRTGPGTALDGNPKFNLELLNPDYFVRLRGRVKAARDRGIYVAIMLFNGFSIERKGNSFENPWRGHPFNSRNNINRVDGDQDGNGEGGEVHAAPENRIARFQEKYVAAVIDAVGDLDNVLYEISNEDHSGSLAWQNRMVGFIRQYESTKGLRHPVGITAEYPGGRNQDLFEGSADWVAPGPAGGYDHDPPPATGRKVIVADTDHIFGTGGDRVWVWKSLTRGLNVLLMDPYDNAWNFPPLPQSQTSHWSELRRSIGNARLYLSRLDLSKLIPRAELSTTNYCLADPASGLYLVYTPIRGPIQVDTTQSARMLRVEWFEPATGKIIPASDVAGGKMLRFIAPYDADAVLLLRASTSEPKG